MNTYTSGCFSYSEQARLQEQYMPFNITALNLQQAISKHAGCGKCTGLSEGRGGLIEFGTNCDGRQVQSNCYNFIQGIRPKTHAAASEVVTLMFLRLGFFCSGGVQVVLVIIIVIVIVIILDDR